MCIRDRVYVVEGIAIIEDGWVRVKACWKSEQITPRTGTEWENERSEELLIDNKEDKNKRGYNKRFRMLPGLVKWKDNQGEVLVKKLTAGKTFWGRVRSSAQHT